MKYKEELEPAKTPSIGDFTTKKMAPVDYEMWKTNVAKIFMKASEEYSDAYLDLTGDGELSPDEWQSNFGVEEEDLKAGFRLLLKPEDFVKNFLKTVSLTGEEDDLEVTEVHDVETSEDKTDKSPKENKPPEISDYLKGVNLADLPGGSEISLKLPEKKKFSLKEATTYYDDEKAIEKDTEEMDCIEKTADSKQKEFKKFLSDMKLYMLKEYDMNFIQFRKLAYVSDADIYEAFKKDIAPHKLVDEVMIDVFNWSQQKRMLRIIPF
jgi:hypothetical protein